MSKKSTISVKLYRKSTKPFTYLSKPLELGQSLDIQIQNLSHFAHHNIVAVISRGWTNIRQTLDLDKLWTNIGGTWMVHGPRARPTAHGPLMDHSWPICGPLMAHLWPICGPFKTYGPFTGETARKVHWMRVPPSERHQADGERRIQDCQQAVWSGALYISRCPKKVQ